MAPNPELHESLRAALASVHLECYFDAACEWCESEGAWSLDELVSEEATFDDFAKDIELKSLEAKRLKKAFLAAVAKESGLDAASDSTKEPAFSPAFVPSSSGYFEGTPLTVKNTFIDLANNARPQMDIGRSKTVGDSSCRRDFEESAADSASNVDGNDAEDEEQRKLLKAAIAGSPIAAGSLELGGRLTTFDAFESSSYWENWSGGTPSTPTGSVNQAVPSVAAPLPMQMWGGGAPEMPMMMPAMMDPFQMNMHAMAGMMAGESMSSMSGPVPDPKPRAQVLERAFNQGSQRERITWCVDARKLKSSDREAVSPTFEVSCGGAVNFRMVMKPKALDDQKGGACFKKSKNKGYVELRCVTELESAGLSVQPTLTFRLQIASKAKWEPFRGPVRHDFSERALCGLPAGQDEWDFGTVIDHSNNTFGVVLELLRDDS